MNKYIFIVILFLCSCSKNKAVITNDYKFTYTSGLIMHNGAEYIYSYGYNEERHTPLAIFRTAKNSNYKTPVFTNEGVSVKDGFVFKDSRCAIILNEEGKIIYTDKDWNSRISASITLEELEKYILSILKQSTMK
jgi:hypothetical protein